jgi:hypothetical protein
MGNVISSTFAHTVNPWMLRASVWGMSDYHGRLEGHIQEIGQETVPWQMNGHQIRSLELLRDEVHFRFPPDFFSPGNLESRDGSWEDEYDWFSDYPQELVRVLKGFRNVERELACQIETLARLGTDAPDDDYRNAFSTVAAALAPACNELDAALSDINEKIVAARACC